MKTNLHLFSHSLTSCLFIIGSFLLHAQDIPSPPLNREINNAPTFAELNVSRRVDGVAQLRWNCFPGDNLPTYFIEHSIDGIHYNTIGQLVAERKGDAFDFLHKEVVKGLNYYRLRVSGADGTSSYSGIQKLFCPRVKQVLRIFPNVAIGTANLLFDANEGEEMQVKILDLTGRAISENVVRFQSQIARLGVQDLDRGLYTVVIKKENGEQFRSKLLVAF
jgi:hypothetical protein